MNKRISMIILVLALLSGVATAVVQPELSVTNTHANAFVSDTGINWVDGKVLVTEAQASIASGSHELSVSYLQVLSLDETVGPINGVSADGQVVEMDMSVLHTFSGIPGIDLHLGYNYRDFTKLAGPASSTEDVNFGLTLDALPLNPRATVHYDLDGLNEGIYGTLGLTQNVPGLPVDLWATTTWTGDNYGAAYFSHDGLDNRGFQSYGLGADAVLPLSDNVSVNLGLGYFSHLDGRGVLGRTHGAWNTLGVDSQQDVVVGTAGLEIRL